MRVSRFSARIRRNSELPLEAVFINPSLLRTPAHVEQAAVMLLAVGSLLPAFGLVIAVGGAAATIWALFASSSAGPRLWQGLLQLAIGPVMFWITLRPLLEIAAMRRSLPSKGYPRYSLAMCLAIRALWAHRVAVTKAAPELPPRDELESLPGCSCESPLELIRYLLEFDRNLLVEKNGEK